MSQHLSVAQPLTQWPTEPAFSYQMLCTKEIFFLSPCLLVLTFKNLYPSLSPQILYLVVSPKKIKFSESSNSLLFWVPSSVSNRYKAHKIHQWLLSCQPKASSKFSSFLTSVGIETAEPVAVLEMFYSCGFYNNISSLYFWLHLWLSLSSFFNIFLCLPPKSRDLNGLLNFLLFIYLFDTDCYVFLLRF